MYLIDTNVISELRKWPNGKADNNVCNWARNVSLQEMFLSAITLFELEVGILRLERKDGKQAVILRKWLDEHVAKAFEGRIIAVNHAIAKRAAALHVPYPWEFNDALIAATALACNLTLVTRNVADFQSPGLELLNPWLSSQG